MKDKEYAMYKEGVASQAIWIEEGSDKIMHLTGELSAFKLIVETLIERATPDVRAEAADLIWKLRLNRPPGASAKYEDGFQSGTGRLLALLTAG